MVVTDRATLASPEAYYVVFLTVNIDNTSQFTPLLIMSVHLSEKSQSLGPLHQDITSRFSELKFLLFIYHLILFQKSLVHLSLATASAVNQGSTSVS